MAKLTRTQVAELRAILAGAEAADDDINRPDVVLMAVKPTATTTLDVTLPDGRVVTEVAKHSRPFVRLDAATTALARFIVEHS